MSEEKLNLFQKIQAVSIEVMNIEKDMTVGSGNYSYKAVSDKEVTLQVKRAEEKFKILSIPIKQDLVGTEILKSLKKDGSESATFVDTIKMTVRFIDLEDVSQFIDVESFGKGVDSGDKGFGKASTYARKYALLNAYKIATGEDPDSEKSKELATVGTDEKKEAIISICTKDVKILNNVLSHFSLGSIDDLSTQQIGTIYNQFKAKKLL
jgi:hypothetical protein